MLYEDGVRLSRQGVLAAFMVFPIAAVLGVGAVSVGWKSPLEAMLWIVGAVAGLSLTEVVSWPTIGRILTGRPYVLWVEGGRLVYAPPTGRGFDHALADIVSTRMLNRRALQLMVLGSVSPKVMVDYLAISTESLQEQLATARSQIVAQQETAAQGAGAAG